MRERLGFVDFSVILVQDDPLKMIQLADVVLCASGTATLMVGLMERPMVIMYRMRRLTAFLARRLVKGTRYFGMVNLIAGRLVAPEFFQEDAEPERLSQELMSLFENKVRYEETVRNLRDLKGRLGDQGATVRVAQALNFYLGS